MKGVIPEGHEVHEGEPDGEYELPEGWKWTKLGNVSNTTRKKRLPKEFPDMPFIGLEHVESETMRLLGTTPAAEMKSAAEYFEPGDVLYGRLRPYLNKVFRPDFEGLCSAEFIIFRHVQGVDSRYLQYFLNSSPFVSFATHLNAGDRPRVSFDQLADYPFPLASEPEQRRIVAKIEKLLTSLDAGVAGLKRIQAALKRYRAAVLKAACEGRLVPQDPNDEPAEKLLERILAERRAKWEADLVAKGKDLKKAKYEKPKGPETEGLAELPEGWCWGTVEQLASVETGATPLRSKPAYYTGGTIPWITSGALNSLYVNTASEYITVRALKETNAKLMPSGSLLVAMYGEGKTRGKVSELRINAATNQAIATLKFDDLAAECRAYVKLFFQGNYEAIRRLSSGGVQPNLNLSIIKNTSVPIAPANEQKRIIAEADRRLSVVAELEKLVESNLIRAERLRQAILRQAFEGKLVMSSNDAAMH